MGLLAKIRNWIMNRLDTNRIEREFNVRITSPMDMQELVEKWLAVYQGITTVVPLIFSLR